MVKRLVIGVTFSPRGGSAHVIRALSHELVELGWSIRLMAGSRSDLGGDAEARSFYAGSEVQPVDFAPALRQADPMHPPPELMPMHPSFEERPGAPDRVYAGLDDREFELQTRAWARELDRAGASEAEVLYLHHLTPLNEAAAAVAPKVPVVGHLHGTELLMLELIEEGPPAGWRFADRWRSRMEKWASRCERLLVSPGGLERARALLGCEEEKLVPLPNGVDLEVFHPVDVNRYEHWHRHLVESPSARLPDGRTMRYRTEDLAPIREGVVLLYVGRFTRVKRLPFLLEAFAKARPQFSRPAALVLLGGYPGEWEGEHPADAIRRLGLREAFIAGWQSQRDLPRFACSADAVILPSDREQFGQTLVEGMACGLPGIAANALGPPTIVEDGETGWLFDPGERDELSEALVEAVNDPAERRRRGTLALQAASERLSWPKLASRLDGVLREVSGPVEAAPARTSDG